MHMHAYDMHMHAYDMHMHAYDMHMHAYDMHMYVHDTHIHAYDTPIHANETRARRVKRACMWKASLRHTILHDLLNTHTFSQATIFFLNNTFLYE